MVDARSSALVTSLPPERVARAEFSTSFRGFDPTEVRAFLARVAGEIRALTAREAELLAELAESERLRALPPEAEELDEHRMTEMLGLEAARVLEAAREAGARIRAGAQQEADRHLEQARAEASSLHSAAESELGEQVAVADLERERLRSEAEVDAASVRDAAATTLAHAEVEAAAMLEQARSEGRRMVAEARQVRERVLTDMARRRNVVRQQLERLKAGRDRLAEAVDHVRRTVEETAAELSGSLPDAKLAGDRAARTVDVDLVPSAAALETEVVVARDAGLIDMDAVERASKRDEPNTAEMPVLPLADETLQREEPPALSEESADVAEVDVAETDVAETDVAETDVVEVDVAEVDVVEQGRDPSEVDDFVEPAANLESSNIVEVTDAEVLDLTDAEEVGPAGRAGFSSAVDAVFSRLREPADDEVVGAGRPSRLSSVAGEQKPASAVIEDSDGFDATAMADRVAVHTRDAQVAGPSRDLTRQLKLALSNSQNMLLELVRERSAEKISPADLKPEFDAATTYAEVARNELHCAAQAGWRSLAGGQTPDDVDLGPVAERLGADLAAELHAQIVEALAGERAHLSDQLRGVYRNARNRRAGELADHGVLGAFTQGQLAAVGSGAVAGGVALVRWVFEACGPDCLDNSLAGPLALGDPFPTGHLHPPAAPGCRCLLVRADDVS